MVERTLPADEYPKPAEPLVIHFEDDRVISRSEAHCLPERSKARARRLIEDSYDFTQVKQ